MFNKKVCKKCYLSEASDKNKKGEEEHFEMAWKLKMTPCIYGHYAKVPLDCPYILEHVVMERPKKC